MIRQEFKRVRESPKKKWSFASGCIIAKETDKKWNGAGLTAITVLIILQTPLHPLWLPGLAGMVGGDEPLPLFFRGRNQGS